MAAIELFSTPLFTDANLLYYYRLEGNSNDAVGTNNGTDTAITYSTGNGKFGQGAGFNGTTSKIALGTVPAFNQHAFSISAWVNFTDFTNRTIFALGNSGNNNPILSIILTSSTGIELINRDDTAFGLAANPTFSALSTGTFIHFVWTCSTTQSNLYINGSNVDSRSFSATGTTTFNTANWGVRQRVANDSFMNGAIDDGALFNRVLTATEVSNLFNGTWLVPVLSDISQPMREKNEIVAY